MRLPLKVNSSARPCSVDGHHWPDVCSCELSPAPARPLGRDFVFDVLRGLGGLGAVGAKHLKRDRAARGMKPLAAAVIVPPAFEMDAFGVHLFKQVAVEVILGRSGAKARDMRLATAVEFGFFRGHAAAGAGQDQHVVPPMVKTPKRSTALRRNAWQKVVFWAAINAPPPQLRIRQ